MVIKMDIFRNTTKIEIFEKIEIVENFDQNRNFSEILPK